MNAVASRKAPYPARRKGERREWVLRRNAVGVGIVCNKNSSFRLVGSVAIKVRAAVGCYGQDRLL